MVDPIELERRLKFAFPDARIRVEDLTGGKDHFKVEIVSSEFNGKTPLQRHRMVHEPLRDLIGGEVHALALVTRTPSEGN